MVVALVVQNPLWVFESKVQSGLMASAGTVDHDKKIEIVVKRIMPAKDGDAIVVVTQ